MFSLLLLLLCCQNDPDSKKPASSTPAVVVERIDTPSKQAEKQLLELASKQRVSGLAQKNNAKAVVIAPQFENISSLHQSFFADLNMLTALQSELSPYLQESVRLNIRYSDERRQGDICLRIAPELTLTSPLNIQKLSSLSTGLARYRRLLTEGFDVRLLWGFDLCIEALDCRFTVLEDVKRQGKLIHPCVTVAGTEYCGQSGEAGTFFTTKEEQPILRCLTGRD